jgi:hypothetical protein
LRYRSPVQVSQGERRSGYDYYKAERVGMVAPQFSILSPEDKTYDSDEVDVSIRYSDTDLDTVYYRVYDRDKERWVTGDLVYVRNRWSSAITFDGKESGIGKISLADGDYAVHIWANSTGWGDMGENIFERKLVNVAEASVHFSVSKSAGVVASTSIRTTSETGESSPIDAMMYGAAGLIIVLVAIVAFLIQRKSGRLVRSR